MKRMIAVGIAMITAVGCDSKPATPPARPAAHTPPAKPASGIEARLEKSYLEAADWIIKQQQPNGAWQAGPPDHRSDSPAYTGLAAVALSRAPKKVGPKYVGAAHKAIAWLAATQGDDGSFSEAMGTLKTYTTSIALMAMSEIDAAKFKDRIAKAQNYLKGHQALEGVFSGGSGYGDTEFGKQGIQPAEASMSTTGYAAEALKASGLPKDDAYWKRMAEFVQRCQNSTETNTDPKWREMLQEKGYTIGNDGSIFYAPMADPDEMKAGTEDTPHGKVIKGYGSMTYEGIKSYIFAGLKKDDPRVKAAVNWVRGHYDVDKHPGFEFDAAKRHHLQGLYYYYITMTKALDAYGETPFVTADGKKHEWPRELAEKFLSLQKEGMWKNENPRWWEADPFLCTCYILSAYDILFKHL